MANRVAFFFCLILSLLACEPDDPNAINIDIFDGQTVCPYAPYTIGSSFTFSSGNKSYTVRVVGDTIVDNEEYKITVNEQTQDRSLFNCRNGIYNTVNIIPTYPTYNWQYLKTGIRVDSSWTNIDNLGGVYFRSVFTYERFDSTRTVLNRQYKDIIQMRWRIYIDYDETISTNPNSDSRLWYARGVGLIETTTGGYKLSNATIVIK